MKPFSTLNSRLWLLIFLAAVPSLVLAVAGYTEQRRLEFAELRQHIRLSLHAGLNEQKRMVEQTRQVLRIMAHADDVSTPASPDCSGLARRLLETQDAFVNFGVADLSGNVVCSALPFAGKVNVADRGWFQEAVRGRVFSRGSYHIGRISGRRTVTFGYPLVDGSGGLRGAVYASIGASWFAGVARTPELMPGWSATVLDREGHILASFPEGAQGGETTIRDAGLARIVRAGPGEMLAEIDEAARGKRWYAIAPLGATNDDVYLALGGSKDAVTAPLDRRLRMQLLGLGAFLLVSLVFGWFFISRSFLRWARSAVDAGKRFGAGDYGSRIGPVGGVAELEQVGRTLDDMAQNVQRREAQHREDALRIGKLNRLYAVLSGINHAIVHENDEEALFRRVCDVIVEQSGFLMAWVGIVDETEHRVRPVASRGGTAYLASVRVSIDEAPEGMCVVGTAFRENRVVICNDVATDPCFAPWREVALEHGYRAAVGIPLRRDGAVTAVLALYAGEAGFFDPDEQGQLVEVGDDISFALERFERERLRVSAEAQLQLAARVFEGSGEGILVADRDGDIVLVNHTFTQITGYTLDEVRGGNPRLLKSGKHEPDFYQNMWARILETGSWQGEIWNRRKDGEIYPEWLSISAVPGPDGAVAHYIGMFSDISERKAADAHILRLTQYDALTALPNRMLAQDRLRQAIVAAGRADRVAALLLIDLDRFKLVNDSLGHGVGDELLVGVAKRLTDALRAGDTVARQGGDEFIVVLSDVADEDDVAMVASHIMDTLRRPLQVGGRELVLTASMGISLFPKDGSEAEVLLKNADVALFRVKDEGRDAFRFFAQEMDHRASRWLAMEGQLRRALERGELELHYQPQVSLVTGQVTGAEALLRWTNAELGRVPPMEFIPLAEDSGLILPIGEWVLRTACSQVKAWQAAGLPAVHVAVNLSASQFRQAGLAELVRTVLRETGLEPYYLELELTESMLMHDVEAAIAVMAELKRLGVTFSLDDFGTGYSSMSYLSRLAFDTLKIDQSFVRDITTNPVNAAIATTTISMARNLHLGVIAEGVENEGQLSFLRRHHCDTMQGYHFSRPLPAEEFAALLGSGKSLTDGGAGAVRPTILLVDDEPMVLHALQRVLRRDGYRILAAANAHEGLELLALHEVQVIVSDQRMPHMSGSEFLYKVKELYPDTIRMILTGYAELESVTEAVNRGAVFRILFKPWVDNQLREHVREAFRMAHKMEGAPL